MLKFLIFAVAAFVLYKLFTGDKKRKQVQQEKTQEQKVASGEMVKDPICGSYVSADNEIRVRQGDKVHHFCSYECRDKYVKQLQAESGEPEDSNS